MLLLYMSQRPHFKTHESHIYTSHSIEGVHVYPLTVLNWDKTENAKACAPKLSFASWQNNGENVRDINTLTINRKIA